MLYGCLECRLRCNSIAEYERNVVRLKEVLDEFAEIIFVEDSGRERDSDRPAPQELSAGYATNKNAD
jgi:hypothetical protein